MLIYKSFFRKKTTRIYFVIYSLIILVIGLLLSARVILENKERELHYGSHILITANKLVKLNNLKNIDKVYDAIIVKIDNYNEMIVIYDEKYDEKENRIIMPKIYKEQFKVKDILKVEVNNKEIELIIDGYDDINGNNDIVYGSDNIIKKYSKVQERLYVITLKDWKEKENVINELKKLDDISDIKIRNYNSINSYLTFISIINVMLIVLIILFVIVLMITCFNIVEDENKKNEIYYKVGYRKNKLKIYNFIKILLLILFASSLSLLVLTFLQLFYKILF